MNLLYPRLNRGEWRRMIGYALAGALIAGSYGILHDEFTYSISPEYFTRLKFAQFEYADFGLRPRIFVAEIGFLATYWVGGVAGWLLARMAVPSFPPALARRHSAVGFPIILAATFGGGVIGWSLGLFHSITPENSALAEFAADQKVRDVTNFVRVAYIHNCGYAGALIGLAIALFYLRGRRAGVG